jgi:hypothetical protein
MKGVYRGVRQLHGHASREYWNRWSADCIVASRGLGPRPIALR